jgi:hypothetical protein
LSNLSKIAYVELLGEDGNVVFHQKVKLEKGRGSADYFIPTSVPSGNYKLLAYTNWMRNVENNFFEGDIILINPYQSNQKELLEEDRGLYSKNALSLKKRSQNASGKSFLSLDLEKKIYGKRQKVKLNISSITSAALKGEYSLSVRRNESLPFSDTKSSVTANTSLEQSYKGNVETLKLPELRGQLISGRIIAGNGVSLNNKVVALSIPNEEGFAQLSSTNEKGQFFFNLRPDVRTGHAVLELINNGPAEIKIEPDTRKGLNPSVLDFPEFSLSPEMKDVILQRSIYNQIENAFFAVKPDTLVPPRNKLPLSGDIVETYELDDYTRFNSMPETFVEIIKSAWVRKNSAGESVFQVRGLMNHVDMGLVPLIMVDGILVRDHEIPVTMDARRIKSIKIIRDKIFLGPASFQGAVLFETISGDFFDQYSAPNIRKIELFNPEVPKKYFRQVYTEENKDNRIPDFRYQLYWEPQLELKDSGEKCGVFYFRCCRGI